MEGYAEARQEIVPFWLAIVLIVLAGIYKIPEADILQGAYVLSSELAGSASGCCSALLLDRFSPMKIIVDRDVAKVAEFMERNMIAPKLQEVAHGLAKLVDLIWAHHAHDNKATLKCFKVENSLTVEAAIHPSPPQQDTIEQDHATV
jgi:hypothetical protein